MGGGTGDNWPPTEGFGPDKTRTLAGAADEHRPLYGKVALVTGSTRKDNLGFAIAKELARQGAAIVICGSPGSTEVRAPARQTELEEISGRRYHGFANGDLSDEDEMRRIIGHTSKHREDLYGIPGVDIFVTAAGTFNPKKSPSFHENIFYRAPRAGHDKVVKLATENNLPSTIIHVTSHAGTPFLPDKLKAYQRDYATSKTALNELVRVDTARLEDSPISVFAIANGSTNTGGLVRELDSANHWPVILERTGLNREEYLATILQPDDVAKVAAAAAIDPSRVYHAWVSVYEKKMLTDAAGFLESKRPVKNIEGPVIYMPSIIF